MLHRAADSCGMKAQQRIQNPRWTLTYAGMKSFLFNHPSWRSKEKNGADTKKHAKHGRGVDGPPPPAQAS